MNRIKETREVKHLSEVTQPGSGRWEFKAKLAWLHARVEKDEGCDDAEEAGGPTKRI